MNKRQKKKAEDKKYNHKNFLYNHAEELQASHLEGAYFWEEVLKYAKKSTSVKIANRAFNMHGRLHGICCRFLELQEKSRKELEEILALVDDTPEDPFEVYDKKDNLPIIGDYSFGLADIQITTADGEVVKFDGEDYLKAEGGEIALTPIYRDVKFTGFEK